MPTMLQRPCQLPDQAEVLDFIQARCVVIGDRIKEFAKDWENMPSFME
jgi:hypothetical protein